MITISPLLSKNKNECNSEANIAKQCNGVVDNVIKAIITVVAEWKNLRKNDIVLPLGKDSFATRFLVVAFDYLLSYGFAFIYIYFFFFYEFCNLFHVINSLFPF